MQRTEYVGNKHARNTPRGFFEITRFCVYIKDIYKRKVCSLYYGWRMHATNDPRRPNMLQVRAITFGLM